MSVQKIYEALDTCKDFLTGEEYTQIKGIVEIAEQRNAEENAEKEAEKNTEEEKETEEETEMKTLSIEEEIKNLEQAELLKQEGTKFFQRGQYESAVEKYTEAIQKDSNNKVLYSNRAAAYAKLSRDEEGIADAEQAIEIDSTYAKAYSRLGAFFFYKNPAESLKNYEKALENDSANSEYKKMVNELRKKVGTQKSTEPGNENQNFDFSQMLNDPNFMSYAQDLMKNKSPEEIENMKKMVQDMMKKKDGV